MQISTAALLASQQTAVAPKIAQPGFAAALQQSQSFAPLEFSAASGPEGGQAPAKTAAHPAPARPGALIDITV